MEELKLGWLSPSGEFIETGMYQHMYFARQIRDRLNLQNKDRIYGKGQMSDDELLIDAGWVSITKSAMSHRWIISWKRFSLSPEQKRFLEPYFQFEDFVDEYVYHNWEDEQEV